MPGAPLSQGGLHAGLLAVSFCSSRPERVGRVPPTLPQPRPARAGCVETLNVHRRGVARSRPREVSGTWPASSTCRCVTRGRTGDRGRCGGAGPALCWEARAAAFCALQTSQPGGSERPSESCRRSSSLRRFEVLRAAAVAASVRPERPPGARPCGTASLAPGTVREGVGARARVRSRGCVLVPGDVGFPVPPRCQCVGGAGLRQI